MDPVGILQAFYQLLDDKEDPEEDTFCLVGDLGDELSILNVSLVDR